MIKRLYLLMGIAILAVVVSHAAGWGQIALINWAPRYRPVASGLDQVGSLPYYVLLITRQALMFAVPVFLFVSGFFLAYATQGTRSGSVWHVIGARLGALLAPYLLWSAVVFFSGGLIEPVRSPLECLALFFTYGATGPFYYVPLLCYCYLLSPLMLMLARTHWRLLLAGAALLQLLSPVADYLGLLGVQGPGLHFVSLVTPGWSPLRWMLYLPLGIVACVQMPALKNWLASHRQLILGLTIVLGILAFVEPEVIFRTTGRDWRYVPETLSGHLYAVAFILCALTFDLVPQRFVRALNRLGSRSYGIYLVHYIAMAFVARSVYHFAPRLLQYQWAFLPILLVSGLVLPMLAMDLVQGTRLRLSYHYLFG